MKKYKLKAELTHEGTKTTYEDDVFFTDMIPSVMNSKTLSKLTKEKDKLSELTGGIILFDSNLEKTNDNIDVDANKIHIDKLDSSGTATFSGISGHIGSICMTTKQNINNYDALKSDCACLEDYEAYYDEKTSGSVVKRQFSKGSVSEYINDWGPSSASLTPFEINKKNCKITNKYASITDIHTKFITEEPEAWMTEKSFGSDIAEIVKKQVEQYPMVKIALGIMMKKTIIYCIALNIFIQLHYLLNILLQVCKMKII